MEQLEIQTEEKRYDAGGHIIVDPPYIPRLKDEEENDHLRVYECKDTRPLGVLTFLKKIEKAIKEGFTVYEDAPVRLMPHFGPIPKISLIRNEIVANLSVEQQIEKYKEEIKNLSEVIAELQEKLVFNAEIEERINSTTKKDDLLLLAEELNIDIPDDIKVPSAIGKFIKDKYREQSSE